MRDVGTELPGEGTYTIKQRTRDGQIPTTLAPTSSNAASVIEAFLCCSTEMTNFSFAKRRKKSKPRHNNHRERARRTMSLHRYESPRQRELEEEGNLLICKGLIGSLDDIAHR